MKNMNSDICVKQDFKVGPFNRCYPNANNLNIQNTVNIKRTVASLFPPSQLQISSYTNKYVGSLLYSHLASPMSSPIGWNSPKGIIDNGHDISYHPNYQPILHEVLPTNLLTEDARNNFFPTSQEDFQPQQINSWNGGISPHNTTDTPCFRSLNDTSPPVISTSMDSNLYTGDTTQISPFNMLFSSININTDNNECMDSVWPSDIMANNVNIESTGYQSLDSSTDMSPSSFRTSIDTNIQTNENIMSNSLWPTNNFDNDNDNDNYSFLMGGGTQNYYYTSTGDGYNYLDSPISEYDSPVSAGHEQPIVLSSIPKKTPVSVIDHQNLRKRKCSSFDYEVEANDHDSIIMEDQKIGLISTTLPTKNQILQLDKGELIKISPMSEGRKREMITLALKKDISLDVLENVLNIFSPDDELCSKLGSSSPYRKYKGVPYLYVKSSYMNDEDLLDHNPNDKDESEISLQFKKLINLYQQQKKGKQNTRPKEVRDHVKRPLNSFMMYRRVQTEAANAFALAASINEPKQLAELIKKEEFKNSADLDLVNNKRLRKRSKVFDQPMINATNNPIFEKVNHKIISKIIGLMWETEEPKVKEAFKQLSEKEKNIHTLLYPNYKFAPKKKSKKN